MRPLFAAVLLIIAAFLIIAGPTFAAGQVVLDRTAARRPAPIIVSSAAIRSDGHMEARNTAYGQNISPALSWRPVPSARAYAVILEDPDALGPTPFVHWLAWNIPGDAGGLPDGRVPTGVVQGRNGHGETGYWGPHPPSGVHRYHIEVFALDAPLALPAGADRDALAGALRGHVIAKGEILGLVAAPHG